MAKKRWSKKSAGDWINAFGKKHEMVPSSAVRAKNDGPDDKTLERLFGSVKKALVDSGAPLQEGNLKDAYSSVGTYQHSNGKILGQKEKKERVLHRFPMRVACLHCGWDETHDTAMQALAAQAVHLEEEHEITPSTRPRQRWKNPTDAGAASQRQIPGSRDGGQGWG